MFLRVLRDLIGHKEHNGDTTNTKKIAHHRTSSQTKFIIEVSIELINANSVGRRYSEWTTEFTLGNSVRTEIILSFGCVTPSGLQPSFRSARAGRMRNLFFVNPHETSQSYLLRSDD